MRVRLAAVLTAGLMALSMGAAAVAAPGGDEDGNNNLTCSGTSTPAGPTVGAGADGIGVCSAGGSVDGRIIVSKDGYIAIDGDSSNSAQAQGYVRIDSSGPHCGTGDSSTNQNSEACG